MKPFTKCCHCNDNTSKGVSFFDDKSKECIEYDLQRRSQGVATGGPGHTSGS